MFEMIEKHALPGGVEEFVAAGNIFDGVMPPDARGWIEWSGSGNTLRLGADVHLINVRIVFIGKRGRISIGQNAVIRGIVRAEDGARVIICRRTTFNRPSIVRACEGGTVRLGIGCLLSNVNIRNSDLHSIVEVKTGKRINQAKDITIGDRVWLAEDVSVYKGVTIGDGSIIGARSTVLKDIPANVAAAGTPARVLREGVTWKRELIPV